MNVKAWGSDAQKINTDSLALPAIPGELWQALDLLYSQIFAEGIAVMCGVAHLYKAIVYIKNNLSIWT